MTPIRTEIIIRATRTREVLGEKGRRIRELTSLVQKRFGFPPDSVELFAERVENRGLCAMAQAESLRYKLLKGLAVRRACYGVLRHIMESGAKGELLLLFEWALLRAFACKNDIYTCIQYMCSAVHCLHIWLFLWFLLCMPRSGCEVVVSGKLRAQRAKSMKFRDGYIISTGEPRQRFVSQAIRSVQLRQVNIFEYMSNCREARHMRTRAALLSI